MQLHCVCYDLFCIHFVIFTHDLNETPSHYVFSHIVFFWTEFRVFVYSAIMWRLKGARGIGDRRSRDRSAPAGSRGIHLHRYKILSGRNLEKNSYLQESTLLVISRIVILELQYYIHL